MATVSAPPAARPASAPTPQRHGTCALTLSIGGTTYRLRPAPPPAGLKLVWTLRKVPPDPLGRPAAYAVAEGKGREQHCTCPDHRINGATCKHIMALRALGLLAPPKARPSRPPADRGARAARGGGFEICDRCGADFDPMESGHPYLCRSCAAEGGAA